MRGWEIFTRNVGQARNGGGGGGGAGVCFLMGGLKIFKVSSHSWQRGANPTILWRTSSPSFSNFVHPPPTSPLPPTPTPTVLSVVLFLWLNGYHTTFDVLLFYLMIIWIYTCQASTWRTLMCVLCNKVSSLLRSDTMWFFTCTLIWYHTHMHTQYTQGPVDRHTHMNIYLHHHL